MKLLWQKSFSPQDTRKEPIGIGSKEVASIFINARRRVAPDGWMKSRLEADDSFEDMRRISGVYWEYTVGDFSHHAETSRQLKCKQA
jgi:hypothetical protein